MPPYLTEPLLAAQLELTTEAIEATDTDEDMEWLLAFLSADQLACYCLYQSARPRLISSCGEPAASTGR